MTLIQRIVKQCDAAVRGLWFGEDRAAGKDALNRGVSRGRTAELYELEELYRKAIALISRRESKNLSKILEALLREAQNMREFYPVQTDAVLEQLYCSLYQAVSGISPEASEKVASLHGEMVYEDAARILTELERSYEDRVRRVSDVTRQVVSYIAEHYAQLSSMAEIAERLNYNDDYLYRRFKQEMGMSFVGYLTQVRLEKAAEMMCSKNMDPTRAAEEVGYASVSYFNKKFKELYGQTPSAWRRNMRY